MVIDLRQLRQAFSPGQNLRHLVTRPASRLTSIDGLRALAVLWIIAMHCVWFQAPFLPAEHFHDRLEGTPRWIIGGPFGVDVFFVISGFLIGTLLMGEHQRHGTIRVGRFYWRRFLKLMPAYVVALAVYCLTVRVNADMAWTNLLYINNFVPGERQAMVWSWSLAIEEQFYFTFPCFLLLVFYRLQARHRLGFLLLLFAVALAIRAVVIWRNDVYAPLPWSVGVGDPRFLDWAERLYIKPHTRFGCLLAGVIAAYLYLHRDVGRFFRERVRAARVLLAVSVLGFAAVVMAPAHSDVPAWPPAASFTFLTSYRYVLGAATAYILLYSLHPLDRPSGAIHALLSWRVWYAVAQLAYSAYLLHPIVMLGFFAAVPPVGRTELPSLCYYLVLPLLSFAAALVMYVLVERPFMNLRDLRRAPRSASANAATTPRRRPVEVHAGATGAAR
jgi:peptidoglycan/LPS O-acetylase OafA/YrhL